MKPSPYSFSHALSTTGAEIACGSRLVSYYRLPHRRVPFPEPCRSTSTRLPATSSGNSGSARLRRTRILALTSAASRCHGRELTGDWHMAAGKHWRCSMRDHNRFSQYIFLAFQHLIYQTCSIDPDLRHRRLEQFPFTGEVHLTELLPAIRATHVSDGHRCCRASRNGSRRRCVSCAGLTERLTYTCRYIGPREATGSLPPHPSSFDGGSLVACSAGAMDHRSMRAD